MNAHLPYKNPKHYVFQSPLHKYVLSLHNVHDCDPKIKELNNPLSHESQSQDDLDLNS